MKERILELLKGSCDYISGEEISEKLKVSRTAVWKHINSLKNEGYIIESSSKKGYLYVKAPDILASYEIYPLLKTNYIGRKIIYFDTLDSTNTEIKKLANQEEKEGLVVISEEQTAGRGRLGRAWASPKYSSVYFSLLLRPMLKPYEVSGITIVMGTAVCRALRKYTGLDVKIKWPNDIIINSKKVCGILTEMNAEIDAVNYIIVGVGINVNISDFNEEIKEIATSLCIELKNDVSRKEVLAILLNEFELLYEEFKSNNLKNILDEFKVYSVTLGGRVRVISVNENYEGLAEDITEDGFLIVKKDNGDIKKVISGDVSVRGINGYV